jgi:hypothetical protein
MKLNIVTALAALAVVSTSTLAFAQGNTGAEAGNAGAAAPAAGAAAAPAATTTKTTKKHSHKGAHHKGCAKKAAK